MKYYRNLVYMLIFFSPYISIYLMIYGEKNPNKKSQHAEKVIQRLEAVRNNWSLFVKENKELQMFAYTQTFK